MLLGKYKLKLQLDNTPPPERLNLKRQKILSVAKQVEQLEITYYSKHTLEQSQEN